MDTFQKICNAVKIAPLMKTLQLPRDTYDKFVIISIDQLRNTVENAVLDNAHDSEL